MKPVLEFRDNGKNLFISGYANITEKMSSFINENGKTFKEVILPKAFERSLKRDKEVLLLLNHDTDQQLSSTSSGMRIFEDDIGLKVEVELTEPEFVQKVRKDNSYLSAWSIGFIERSSTWQKENGYNKRLISDLELLECSLLTRGTTPAYPSSKIIEIRSSGMVERRHTNFEPIKDPIVDLSAYTNKLSYLKLKGLL